MTALRVTPATARQWRCAWLRRLQQQFSADDALMSACFRTWMACGWRGCTPASAAAARAAAFFADLLSRGGFASLVVGDDDASS